MKVGPYQLSAVEMGEFRLDGGAMFGVVPKVLWERSNPADEKNRIQMRVRSLLIRGEGRAILVDSGLGETWSDKQKEMFAVDHRTYNPDLSLAALGLKRADITDVVVSHLHFDHVGGAVDFPKARIYVHKENLNHSHAPTEKDRASFLSEKIEPLLKSDRLVVTGDDHEIAPGVTTWVTHGHTPGHQMVKVSDGKTTVLCPGDTIPTASHIPVAWVMGYDLYPMTTIAEKKVILRKAVDEKWSLFFVHDPFIAACNVLEKDGKFLKGDVVVTLS